MYIIDEVCRKQGILVDKRLVELFHSKVVILILLSMHQCASRIVHQEQHCMDRLHAGFPISFRVLLILSSHQDNHIALFTYSLTATRKGKPRYKAFRLWSTSELAAWSWTKSANSKSWMFMSQRVILNVGYVGVLWGMKWSEVYCESSVYGM